MNSMGMIYDLLCQIRQKYALYIGRKDLRRLGIFLSGYECALFDAMGFFPEFNGRFQQFVGKKLGQPFTYVVVFAIGGLCPIHIDSVPICYDQCRPAGAFRDFSDRRPADIWSGKRINRKTGVGKMAHRPIPFAERRIKQTVG